MRLGVFGGTFDPVHTGHLVAAETAREAADLDAVMFVPAGEPWLKDGEVVGIEFLSISDGVDLSDIPGKVQEIISPILEQRGVKLYA